jgi:RimJ/RimL family protein N-acetyltransferase
MLREVAREADSFPFELDMERDESVGRWLSPDRWTYVGCLDDEVVGTYALRPNHGGPGSHVANAGYIVKSEHRGKGIGTAMVEHSLKEAKRLGFEAMQFNLVVSTNEGAVHVYQKLGFRIVGTLPKAFRHERLGLVDAYVMHRFL